MRVERVSGCYRYSQFKHNKERKDKEDKHKDNKNNIEFKEVLTKVMDRVDWYGNED